MTKLLFSAMVALALISCKGEQSHKEAPAAAAASYQCPMKCTEEIFSEPGQCPVCKMDLQEISES